MHIDIELQNDQYCFFLGVIMRALETSYDIVSSWKN